MNNLAKTLKRTLLPLGVAVAGTFIAAAPAHAFLIDGFGDDQASIQADGPSGNNPVTVTSSSEPITDTDFDNALRTLMVERTGGGGNVDMRVDEDKLFYSQGSGTFGRGMVDWTDFAPVAFSGNAHVLVSVLEADLAAGGLEITLGSSSAGLEESIVAALPQVTFGDDPETVSLSLAGFSPALLASVDYAQLEIDGRSVSSLDVTIDYVEIPAPGVLGLLGLGLAGLAFTVRRRRSGEEGVVSG